MDKNLYFIAIIPDLEVSQKVTELKREVALKFSSHHALYAPPHITLHMPFRFRADREDRLLDFIMAINSDMKPISTVLNGFDFFEPRVVFVNVEANDSLRKLQHTVVTRARRELKLDNANYKDRPFHPHVTIGFRDLKKAAFFEAKVYYESREFREEFIVTETHLLKHDGASWQKI